MTTHTTPNNTRARRYFSFVANHPKTLILLSVILMAAMLQFLPQLTKDTRGDAFMAPDNPALLYRDKVKQQFGLADPFVIAVVHQQANGIYQPQVLQLVDRLTQAASLVDNIDPERIMSLATENNIEGSADSMAVTGFFDPLPQTPTEAERLQQAIADFPLYQGKLVSRDGQATLIVIEMLDDTLAEQTYWDLQAVIDAEPTLDGVKLHLAGEGAVAGFLGSYVDADASRLNPMAGLIITLIIAFAFRRLAPALLANVIIAASVLMTLGIMAGSGTPFYVITNALPVILIGISVADAIHIFSQYYELQTRHPEQSRKQLVIEAMVEMWRPITLTTLTTMAGFLGLYFASYMPPFKMMGVFTALGVAVAWLYSMVFLPAALAWMQPKVSPRFVQLQQAGNADLFARMMSVLGKLSLRHAGALVSIGAVLGVLGAYSASQLPVDEDRIKTFHPSEPIYQADRAINRHLDGTNNLDIVIETPNPEDLFEPHNLRKIEALQHYALTLPHVNNATSIVDYLKQMNRVLNEGHSTAYTLPDSKQSVAQYFLLYSASSDPTDFEEEVDYDYRMANVRLLLDSAAFSHTQPVVEALQAYIDREFQGDEIKATLSGRVTVNYHWIKDIGASHFYSLGIALLLVWVVSALLFRSIFAGVLALIPVVSAILLIYSVMGLLGITLGIGTSMFASVAIGLGVDFAIHTLDRIRHQFGQYRDQHQRIDAAEIDRQIGAIFPTTGRALLFNFLAIACGFGVLISSQVVPLTNFGTIVALAVTTSFVASMTLLPALIKLLRPGFIFQGLTVESLSDISEDPQTLSGTLRTLAMPVLLSGLALSVLNSAEAEAHDLIDTAAIKALPSGDWVVNKVNSMDDGLQVSRTLTMHLTDRRGKQRVRETRSFRKYFGDDKRTVLFYLSPTNVKDTGFLTYDYPYHSEVDDDQWLYLPALRKVRRISASDRGDYFLGTDFTYEDIKKEGKLEPQDYHYTTVESERIDQRDTFKLAGQPRTEAIAKELGYSRTEFWVDTQSWLVIKANYWDIRGNLLKTMTATDIREIDGIWTRHQLTMNNHKTGHTSEFVFSDVDYQTPVKDSLFSQRALARGL
jgi:predicted RND superfamily exporter protein